MSDQPATVIENFLVQPPASFKAQVEQHRRLLAEDLHNQSTTILQRIQRAGDELRVTWPEVFVEGDFGVYFTLLLEVRRDFGEADRLLVGWEQSGPSALARAGELATEIEEKYDAWETGVIDPMLRYSCLLAEPPVYQAVIPVFTAALAKLREQFTRNVEPVIKQNLEKFLGMYGARQLARFRELAAACTDARRILALAVADVESLHRDLEQKYGVPLTALVVSFTPPLPALPESVTVTIAPGKPPAAPALEGS